MSPNLCGATQRQGTWCLSTAFVELAENYVVIQKDYVITALRGKRAKWDTLYSFRWVLPKKVKGQGRDG